MKPYIQIDIFFFSFFHKTGEPISVATQDLDIREDKSVMIILISSIYDFLLLDD